MSKEKQIEEMAKIMCDKCSTPYCEYREKNIVCDAVYEHAQDIYNAGYRKQIVGEWEWFEEWSPSTPDHPRECDDCGWRCGECKTALEDIACGEWDDFDKKPNLKFCPNCGAKMKGGAEIPTADVVPKSEAESLTLELKAMRGSANSYKMHYNNLAREIFMDIDRVVEKYSMGDIEYSEFVDIIAELKKKYTEEIRYV